MQRFGRRKTLWRTSLTVVVGLTFGTLVAIPPVVVAARTAQPSSSIAPTERAGLIGDGWQRSGDRLWTTTGDSSGFHVLTADARTGYAWRTLATLAHPGIESSQWIGNACATASGAKAVVVYAPREFTNQESLFDRGGFTAIVDLGSGTVTPVQARTSLAYFNPGCGADERAALTQATEDKTGVLVVDAATGAVSPRVELPGQATSAVPSGDDVVVAGLGRLEKVSRTGKRTLLSATSGIAHRLRPDSGGGVVFSEHERDTSRVRRAARGVTTTLATSGFGEVDTAASRGGKVLITGAAKVEKLPDEVGTLDAPVGSRASSDGEMAIVDQADPLISPGMPARQQIKIGARSTKTGKTVNFAVEPTPGRTSPDTTPQPGQVRPSGTAEDSVDAGAVCSVERNNPRLQIYQPSPRQVEWAADRAVFGKLMIERPADWKHNGMAFYYKPQEQTMFPSVQLKNAPNAHVPAQILLGVLGQESNLWQAKRHVLPGQTGNPLVGNYYGVDYYNDTPDDDWTIDWNKADCGYGIGQVTDGMRKPGHPHPNNPGDPPREHNRQLAIATDYTANAAAALQILQSKWNQLQDVGMTVNNNDPGKIENWFFALWAYNSGYHVPGKPGTNGAYGLGWGNNPVNPKYDPVRQPFGKNPKDFATPQKWPYPEKVIGFASNPPSGYEHPGAEVPFFRAANWPGGDIGGPLNRDNAKPPVQLFCNDSNLCYPDRPTVKPNAPEVLGEPMGPCYHTNAAGQYDLKCWFNKPATWKVDCPRTCGVEFVRFDDDYPQEQPIRKDSDSISYPPRCVTTGLPVDALLIDNVPHDVPTVSPPAAQPCGKAQSAGSFDLSFGSPAAKIDLHQVGGGYGAHFWWTETKQDLGSSDNALRVTGTWTLNRKLAAASKVYVHVPDHLAKAEATYLIDTAWGPARRTVRLKDAPGTAPDGKGGVVTTTTGNRWVYLGGFMFDDKVVPRVRMSNLDQVVPRSEVAFDAVAFAPMLAEEKPDDIVAEIVNKNSEKCLVVKDNSTNELAFAIQRTCARTFTDYWLVRLSFSTTDPASGETTGHYQIINRNSGLCLSVLKNKSHIILTEIVQASCSRTDYKNTWEYHWGPPVESGLRTSYGELEVVVHRDSKDDGAPLVLGESTATSSTWNIVRLN